MYVPSFTAIDEPAARALVDEIGTAWLVTSSTDGPPDATSLPILWREHDVIAHMARANPHWRTIDEGAPALLIVSGPGTYVSPSWYASKAEHGKVVPTWNYLAVHLTGTVHVHHEPDWLLDAVTGLTDHHEGRRHDPWRVDDAPDEFVAAQLRGIVGIEVRVDLVEGKAKLSQNRSEHDRAGVVAGLRARAGDAPAAAIADAMVAADAGRDHAPRRRDRPLLLGRTAGRPVDGARPSIRARNAATPVGAVSWLSIGAGRPAPA